MYVTVLLFDRDPAQFRAFESVMDCDEVASCTIEPDYKRVRFVAPTKATERLVDAIYQQGGLAWCSRHALLPERSEEGREDVPQSPRPTSSG